MLQLLRTAEVDLIVFSSNDEKALAIAREHEQRHPARIRVVWRDECFIENDKPRAEACQEAGGSDCDTRGCTISEYLQYIARKMIQLEAKHVLYAPVTAPLFNEPAYSRQIQEHLKHPSRGVVPVTTMTGYFFHQEKPLTFDPLNCLSTQDSEGVQWATWPSMIGSVGAIASTGWFGEDVVRVDYPMETTWEINTEMQFVVAQTLYSKYIGAKGLVEPGDTVVHREL